MKQEWKPDELRATAAEIREAVMPKSITPEMVGGTLAGLTEAVAEVGKPSARYRGNMCV